MTDSSWVDELPEPLRSAALRNAEERVAQHLSPHIEDPVLAARLARILTTNTEADAA